MDALGESLKTNSKRTHTSHTNQKNVNLIPAAAGQLESELRENSGQHQRREDGTTRNKRRWEICAILIPVRIRQAACVLSKRGGPVTPSWFRKMMARLGKRADIPFGIHPHILRHSCGHK
jgi:integrase